MTVTPHRPARPTAWRNSIFVIFALNGLGVSTWISRTPGIRDLLHISVLQVGLFILGGSIGAIIGLALASHIHQWLGGRRTIMLAFLIQAVGLVAIGYGAAILGSYPAVIAGMFLFGFSSSICDVAMNVEGAAVEKVIGRTTMPLFHASWSAGTVIGAGIGALAAFNEVPIWAHLGAVGAVVAIAAVVATRAVPAIATHADTGAPVAHVGFRDRMSIWLEPRTLLIGLIALGMAFTEGSANDWLAIGMVDDRGLDNGQGAVLFAIFSISMTAGRIGGGPLIDRFGRVLMVRGTAVIAAIGLATVIFVPIIPIAIVGIVLWGLGASLGFPVAMSAAADDPVRAAARVSAVATIGYFAFLVGPPLIGFVGEHVGLLNGLLIVLGLLVLAAIVAPAARELTPRTRGVEVLSEPNASEQV